MFFNNTSIAEEVSSAEFELEQNTNSAQTVNNRSNFANKVLKNTITVITAPLWIPASIIFYKQGKDYFSTLK